MATGQVVNFSERDWKGKKLYSVLLNQNGAENWFGMGEKSPAAVCGKGDVVSFEVEQKGKYANIKDGVLSVDVKATQTSGGTSGSSNSREQYWEDKAARDLDNDIRYNTRAAAMFAKDIVLALYTNGDLKVPAKATPVDFVLNNIDLIAADYTARWMDTVYQPHEDDEADMPDPNPNGEETPSF
jgi:hypothetical protein